MPERLDSTLPPVPSAPHGTFVARSADLAARRAGRGRRVALAAIVAYLVIGPRLEPAPRAWALGSRLVAE